jgi:hypothetical protein
MSNKTDFKIVVMVSGRVLREDQFSIKDDTSALEIRYYIARVMESGFDSQSIKTLQLVGITTTIMCGHASHEVNNIIKAIKWVREQV